MKIPTQLKIIEYVIKNPDYSIHKVLYNCGITYCHGHKVIKNMIKKEILIGTKKGREIKINVNYKIKRSLEECINYIIKIYR